MAFLQSAPPRQPIFRVPQVVMWLIAGLSLAHAARVIASPARSLAIISAYAFVPARYSHAFMAAHPGQAGTFWDLAVPFISYMGLHSDFTHLAVNCLWLLAFGPTVARRFGTPLFLAFFIICGVAGAATHLAFNWGSPMPVVGASGAISGLMAAAVRMLPQAQPWAVPGEAPLAPIFSRPILVFSAVWAAINVLAGLTGLGFGGDSGLIAWQVHLGSFAVGLVLCGPFDRLRPRGPGLPLEA
jgi:membrane associated rhomboid family serine protease